MVHHHRRDDLSPERDRTGHPNVMERMTGM